MDIKYGAKDILEKDFKTAMRGYNQDEVDHFLDEVIQDYELYNKKIEQLQNENRRLRTELEESPKSKQLPRLERPILIFCADYLIWKITYSATSWITDNKLVNSG